MLDGIFIVKYIGCRQVAGGIPDIDCAPDVLGRDFKNDRVYAHGGVRVNFPVNPVQERVLDDILGQMPDKGGVSEPAVLRGCLDDRVFTVVIFLIDKLQQVMV